MVDWRDAISADSPPVVRLEVHGWRDDHRNRVSPVGSIEIVVPRSVRVVPVGSAIPMAVMVSTRGRCANARRGEQNGEQCKTTHIICLRFWNLCCNSGPSLEASWRYSNDLFESTCLLRERDLPVNGHLVRLANHVAERIVGPSNLGPVQSHAVVVG